MDKLRSRSRSRGDVSMEQDRDQASMSISHDSLSDTWDRSILERDRQAERDKAFDSTLSLYRASQFELYFLGMILDVNLGGTQRDADVQLIDRVEEAQLEGKIHMFPREENLVKLTITKHGLKVMDHVKQEVLQRHPLHTVAQIVYYNDSFFKSNLAIKVGAVGRTVYTGYIFQCLNEEQAQNVCQSLKEVFDNIAYHAHTR